MEPARANAEGTIEKQDNTKEQKVAQEQAANKWNAGRVGGEKGVGYGGDASIETTAETT